jgi:hypothetical protein
MCVVYIALIIIQYLSTLRYVYIFSRRHMNDYVANGDEPLDTETNNDGSNGHGKFLTSPI